MLCMHCDTHGHAWGERWKAASQRTWSAWKNSCSSVLPSASKYSAQWRSACSWVMGGLPSPPPGLPVTAHERRVVRVGAGEMHTPQERRPQYGEENMGSSVGMWVEGGGAGGMHREVMADSEHAPVKRAAQPLSTPIWVLT